MHKIIFFFQEKNKQKYWCLPYLKFSDLLLKKHFFFFIWQYMIWLDQHYYIVLYCKIF